MKVDRSIDERQSTSMVALVAELRSAYYIWSYIWTYIAVGRDEVADFARAADKKPAARRDVLHGPAPLRYLAALLQPHPYQEYVLHSLVVLIH
jgi:hypothetical protein